MPSISAIHGSTGGTNFHNDIAWSKRTNPNPMFTTDFNFPKNKRISDAQIRSVQHLPMIQQARLMLEHKVGIDQYAKATNQKPHAVIDKLIAAGVRFDIVTNF